jgi:YfiH family protein
MPKTITCNSQPAHFTSSTFELVKWPHLSSNLLNDKVIALQTTRLPFHNTTQPPLNAIVLETTDSIEKNTKGVPSPYGSFNLGLHVGDSPELVTDNRSKLKIFINKQLSSKQVVSTGKNAEIVDIQWLEQVHGNVVTTVTSISEQAIVADASITREKNIALAIMTADCLPILLSHKEGTEIAAIHGGWRPLVTNIIEKTVEQMYSKPANIVAWLGPCIGKDAFEVGGEVKEAFIQLDLAFNRAFVKQDNGKYLANLHLIAQHQLESLGIKVIAHLGECTYQESDKYYSYRKEQVTGRMASIICRR